MMKFFESRSVFSGWRFYFEEGQKLLCFAQILMLDGGHRKEGMWVDGLDEREIFTSFSLHTYTIPQMLIMQMTLQRCTVHTVLAISRIAGWAERGGGSRH